MKIKKTNLENAFLIEPKIFEDKRGFFYESFNEKQLKKIIKKPIKFVQDNHSRSKKNILRGLHYQIKRTQDKLVRVTYGSVYDVIVDLRFSSKTFGKWFGIELSAENKKQLFVPKGFAHSFLVLSEYAEFQYKTSDYYYPNHERVLLWNCPKINIKWPNINPELNQRDLTGLPLDKCEIFK